MPCSERSWYTHTITITSAAGSACMGWKQRRKCTMSTTSLGGNGTVTKLMEDLKELPVRDKLAVMQEQQEQEEVEAKD